MFDALGKTLEALVKPKLVDEPPVKDKTRIIKLRANYAGSGYWVFQIKPESKHLKLFREEEWFVGPGWYLEHIWTTLCVGPFDSELDAWEMAEKRVKSGSGVGHA